MTHQFTVSDLGLRLIKAYEGYRAESRKMISGDAVVGYGHRLADQDVIALTREEAESLLREDIQPVEELVNEAIFAPLSQSQFDALCSLAYNIGPDAFLSSNVVKAINNGRPIDAANGFDVWRKGEVDGQLFVIDALVRRRTAEKALFLKPDRRYVASPRDSLPPVRDDILSVHGRASAPIYTADDAQGFVDHVPYDARPNPGRRRADGPAGILELSEYVERDEQTNPEGLGFVPNIPLEPETENGTIDDNAPRAQALASDDDKDAADAEMPLTLSPIAEVAAEVSNRLDALIDDFDGQKTDLSDMPDTLLDAEQTQSNAVVLPFRGKAADAPAVNDDADIDKAEPHQSDDVANTAEIVTDEAVKGDSSERFFDRSVSQESGKNAAFAFVVMLLSGMIMFGLSLYAWFNDPESILGVWGPIATLTGMIMGGVIILGSIYYIMKLSFGPHK